MKIGFINKLLIFCMIIGSKNFCTPPKLTVIVVVDQLAYHYLQTLAPHLKNGLGFLNQQGVSYANAFMPHGMPATGTGHPALNTGTFASDHGIVGNSWINAEGKRVACDDDSPENSAVIGPQGLYKYGKSPKNIMVEGISDSFVFASSPKVPHHAYSIGGKSRATIGTINKLGKAIWFDEASGNFTSSTYYFKNGKIPDWVNTFNKEKNLTALNSFKWNLAYPSKDNYYNFYDAHNYTFSRPDESFINKEKIKTEGKDKDFFEYVSKTPLMSELIFDLSKKCIEEHIDRQKPDSLLLWVCISNLDKIGHTFGCNSAEAIDTVYHIDKQLKHFISFAQKKAGAKETLFVLTSDHGMAPMPEIAHERGFSNAQRINRTLFTKEMNEAFKTKYNLSEDHIFTISGPNVHINQTIVQNMNSKEKNTFLKHVRDYLKTKSFIKNAWTYNELYNSNFCCNQREAWFKNQLFPHRSGSVIFQTYPNTFITKYEHGADHKTAYEADTHIPLIVYRQGYLERKKITQRVYAQQLANSLAYILNISNAQASTFEVLPNLFDPELFD